MTKGAIEDGQDQTSSSMRLSQKGRKESKKAMFNYIYNRRGRKLASEVSFMCEQAMREGHKGERLSQ